MREERTEVYAIWSVFASWKSAPWFWNYAIIIALLEVPTFEDRSPFLRSNYEQVGSVFRDPLLTTILREQ